VVSDFDAFDKLIKEHVAEDHSGLSRAEVKKMVLEAERMKEQHIENTEVLSHVLIAVQGVPDHDFQGRVIGYHGGIQNDVRELKNRANGGGGFSVTTSSKLMTALITTGMIASAQIIVALIGRI